MKNVARMFAAAVFFAGLLRIASTGIPETITYQGRLTDVAGVPVNDGRHGCESACSGTCMSCSQSRYAGTCRN